MQTVNDISGNVEPLFSIITPTYRRPSLLKRTINSVLCQTFRNFEHIIIDDANDPETERVVSGFMDSRIRLYSHMTQSGAAASYNSGIKISKGSFLLFLDDDDEYLPSFLEKMNKYFLNATPDIGFFWTGFERVLDTEEGEKRLLSKIWPSSFKSREAGIVEATSIGNGYGVCIRRECIDAIGLYDETIQTGQDTEFLFRLAEKYNFETIPEVLVRLHTHSSSRLNDERNNLMRLELRERFLLKHEKLLKEFPDLYYVHYKVVARLCYALKLKQRGRKTMLEIIRNSSFRITNFSDILFFELSGKDTVTLIINSKIRNIISFVKGK